MGKLEEWVFLLIMFYCTVVAKVQKYMLFNGKWVSPPPLMIAQIPVDRSILLREKAYNGIFRVFLKDSIISCLDSLPDK